MNRLLINENVLKDTRRCRKNFICLTGEGECLCELRYCYNGKSYFIKADNNTTCNYKVSFANHVLCSCPTRKEIYNRYRI